MGRFRQASFAAVALVAVPGGVGASAASAAMTAGSPPTLTIPPTPTPPPAGGGVTGPGAVGASGTNDCNVVPQQPAYQLEPLWGCQFVPPIDGWDNEMCDGDGSGGYYCKELGGTTEFNLQNRQDYVAYKDDTIQVTNNGSAGARIVTQANGYTLEGCFPSWVHLPNGRYMTNCDYKVVDSHPLPGWGSSTQYVLSVLQHWSSDTYNQELMCAKAIVGEWVGSNTPLDAVAACADAYGGG